MVTLMIPTKNRSEFLSRLLKYYVSTGYKHRISVGDSSNPEHLQRTKLTLREVTGKINIDYREYQSLNDKECVKKMILNLSTPYAVFLPDDDFITPVGLEECIKFLESRPEYSGCNGIGVIASLNIDSVNNKTLDTRVYNMTIREEVTAIRRLERFLNQSTVPLFSVIRTSIWKKLYENNHIADRAFGCELLPSCLSVIYGKIGQIDRLYLIRYLHEQRYLLSSFQDWISSQNWLAGYNFFMSRVSEELARIDNIEINQARSIVKAAFWGYVQRKLKSTSAILQNNDYFSLLNVIKIELRKYPLVNKHLLPKLSVLKVLRNRVYSENKLSLRSLLSRNSPYYNDFSTVYKILINSVV